MKGIIAVFLPKRIRRNLTTNTNERPEHAPRHVWWAGCISWESKQGRRREEGLRPLCLSFLMGQAFTVHMGQAFTAYFFRSCLLKSSSLTIKLVS